MSSQIFGNVLITFILGLIGKVAYFIVLTALGGKLLIIHRWQCISVFDAAKRKIIFSARIGDYKGIGKEDVCDNGQFKVHILQYLSLFSRSNNRFLRNISG